MSLTGTDFPVIDLSEGATPEGRRRLSARIDEACTEIGFFLVTGHRVADTIVGRAWAAAAAFFDCPTDVKLEVPMSEAYPYGYAAVGEENLARGAGMPGVADPKESFCIGPSARGGTAPVNRWPSAPSDLSDAWLAYYDAMVVLSNELLSLFAGALSLPPQWFVDKTDRHASALRALNYPVLSQTVPAGFVRAGAHTDYGTLTILRSGGPGLQIATPSQTWVNVPELPGSFVVNIGDLMAYWTNDRWTSTLHRVVAVSTGHQLRRQSMAFFHNANPDTLVTCIPTCASADNPAKYAALTAGEHLRMKHGRSTRLDSPLASGY